jgi:hypothetical protein
LVREQLKRQEVQGVSEKWRGLPKEACPKRPAQRGLPDMKMSIDKALNAAIERLASSKALSEAIERLTSNEELTSSKGSSEARTLLTIWSTRMTWSARRWRRILIDESMKDSNWLSTTKDISRKV